MGLIGFCRALGKLVFKALRTLVCVSQGPKTILFEV